MAILKYACPPWYECRCPLGALVSRSTMLRHRRKANANRKAIGRGPFGWGPTVADKDATEYRFTCFDSLVEHETDVEVDLPSPKRRRTRASPPSAIALSDFGGPPDGQTAHSLAEGLHSEERDRTYSSIGTDTVGSEGDRENQATHDQTESHSRVTSACINDDTVVALQNTETPPRTNPLQPVTAVIGTSADCNIQHEEISGSDSNQSSADYSVPLDEGEISENVLSAQTSQFNIEMRNWLKAEQKWVRLLYKHGIEYSAMDDVLHNVDAPCRSTKTVVSHMLRHAGVEDSVETFLTCPGHFCFAQLPGCDAATCCSVCGKHLTELVTRKENGHVRYIRLMPRIAAAVRSSTSCEKLYDYAHRREALGGVIGDFFDGKVYKELQSLFGGEERLKDDIFLAISTDGFQAFKNKIVDVWPVLGILFNLPPSERYKVHNVIPFLFTTDAVQPKDLQSFLIPLMSEIISVYREGGRMLQFHDGTMRRVRVHLVCVTADLAALVKLASLSGYNGKTPCRYCKIQGYYIPSARHYYFPFAVLVSSRSSRRKILYNLRQLPQRSIAETEETFDRLREASTHAERQRISRETGITGRSVLFDLSTLSPYRSFPPDIMHLLYNVQKHLLEIQTSGLDEPFTISEMDLRALDEDIMDFHSGVSGQLAPKPRKVSDFQNWKSIEHKQFSLSYCLVLFDGYLPQDYMDGTALFVEIVDICFRLNVAQQDVVRLRELCVKFLEHFESRYVRHSPSRFSFCKYIMHLLLHLSQGVEDYGPLISVSQYWVEKYIGWIVGRNNARNLVAESMTKRALFAESYKILYEEQFASDTDSTMLVPPGKKFTALGPHRKISLTGRNVQFKNLIISYLIRKFDSITIASAKAIASRLSSCVSSSRLAYENGSDAFVAKVQNASRRKRPSCYVAAEVEEQSGAIDVYYGTLVDILSIELSADVLHGFVGLEQFIGTYVLVQCYWASDMLRGRQGQIYKNCSRSRAFSRQTLEDASLIRRLIGVVEHQVPVPSGRKRVRTYFIDNAVREHNLLHAAKVSLDGVNRNLKGFQRRS